MLFGCGASARDMEQAAAAGFDYVEMPCRAVTSLSEGDFRLLLAQVEQSHIPVLAMNIYCPPEVIIAGPGFDLNAAEAYADTASYRASLLGARVVGIGSPNSRNLPEGFDRALALNQLEQFLVSTADQFGRRGITVCFEALGPCFCNFVQHLAEAVDVVKKIKHPHLAAVLDFYNMEHSGEADMDFSGLMPWIRHAHLSDDDGSPTRRSYLLPEKSGLHEARLNRLREYGYDGMVTLEIDVPVDVQQAKDSLSVMRRPWQPRGDA